MKYLLMLSAFFVIAGCNYKTPSTDQLERDEHSQAIRKPLTLNNGAKWQLDQSTRENVADLKMIMNQASNKNLDSIGVNLKTKTNELIKECRMEGPAHAALHNWLENFIEDQKLVNNKELAPDKVIGFLRADLNDFDKYFQ